MKMLSLKQKITRPYVGLIIVLQLFVLIIFNLLVGLYAYGQAEENLSKVAKRLKQDISYANEPDNFDGKAPPHMLLGVFEQGENTQIIIKEDGQYTDFKRGGEESMPQSIMQKAGELTSNAKEEEIVSFNEGGEYYHAMWIDIEELPEGQTAIYISQGYFAEGFVEMVNVFMVLILLLSVIVFIAVSQKLAKDIAMPIQEISKTVKQMKSVEILNVNEAQNSFELKELAIEINEMNERIYNYDKKQKAFLQNVSHELRTPLTSIQGYAEGVMQNVFEDKDKAMSVILQETKRITYIVDNILSLARLENFEGKYKQGKVNLNEFVQNCVLAVDGLAQKNGKEINFVLPKQNVFVNANEELLRQSIFNILSNAVRHTEKKIDVRIKEDNKNVNILISDDGKGISETDLPHIFERFYKGENGNCGLGLPIAKASVEMMKGELTAKNTKQGAEFIISLSVCK